MSGAIDGSGDERYDLVVVGAGPAGAAAALHGATRGLRTLIVDRSEFPRDKVCGSCLHPRAVAELAALGGGLTVERLGALRLDRARVGARGRWAELPLEGAWALSRRRLDAALVEAARAAGADLRTSTVARLERCSPGAPERRLSLTSTAGTPAPPVRAALVVAADGLGGPLLARSDELAAPPAPDARVGLGATVAAPQVPLDPGRVVLAVGERGYLGLVRLEDGRLDLAAAIDPAVLAEGGPARACAAIARSSGLDLDLDGLGADWAGTPPLTRRPPVTYAHRALAVGDAAGYVEPFTGEGIAWALASARLAADYLPTLAARWSERVADRWAAETASALGRRRRRCAAVARFVRRPSWVATAAPLVARSRVVAALVARVGYGRAR